MLLILTSRSKPFFQCEICFSTMASWDHPVMMSCKHSFCKNCWESYLTTKIQDGDAHHILCPAYQCHILVPAELIEKLVSPDMARRYLQFDIKVSNEIYQKSKIYSSICTGVRGKQQEYQMVPYSWLWKGSTVTRSRTDHHQKL